MDHIETDRQLHLPNNFKKQMKRISLLNWIRIAGILVLVIVALIINSRYNQIERKLRNDFIDSQMTFVVDSIERLSRSVLIHLHNSDSSFYEYSSFLPLYGRAFYRDSVVKEPGVNGFFVYRYNTNYEKKEFVKVYE